MHSIKKKILIIDSQKQFGGGETYKLDIIKVLSKEKYSFTLSTPENSEFKKMILEQKWDWIEFKPKSRLDIFGMIKYANYLKKFNFDIIFTSDSITWYTGIFLKKICKPALLFAIIHISTIASGKKFGFLKRFLIKHTDRFWTKFYTQIICSTKWHADNLLNEGVNRNKITVIHNTVDVESIEKKLSGKIIKDLKQQYKIEEEEIVIGMTGRFGPGKDFETFVNAASLVLKKCDNCKFLLMGDGPEKEKIVGLTKQLNIEENVIFTGFVKEEYYNTLNIIDIFVNSTYAEGISYVILDTMALGKPIVATDAGGIKEAVENEINGYLTPVRNFNSMADKVFSIIKDTESLKKFGENSRRIQREKFSLGQMSKQLNTLLDKYN